VNEDDEEDDQEDDEEDGDEDVKDVVEENVEEEDEEDGDVENEDEEVSEEEDEENDDDDDDDAYINNSPEQLGNFRFEAGGKFKDRKTILVDGYDFYYRKHQDNNKKTCTWYR